MCGYNGGSVICWHNYKLIKTFGQQIVNSKRVYTGDENHITVFKCKKCGKIKVVFHTNLKKIPEWVVDNYAKWRGLNGE